MLDLPGLPILDKVGLIGNCLKLPLAIDAERLRVEVDALPGVLWGAGGRVGVQSSAQALFLRGYAPAEGERPIEDREPLRLLPYVRHIIGELLPAPAQRCLLARLPAGATIAPHVDRAAYFAKTLRLHVPVATHELAFMIAGELTYSLRAGEVWVLNNSARHAVWNAHPGLSRTHLIWDVVPTSALLALLQQGDRRCGVDLAEVRQHLATANRVTVGG
jgi:Aspartyl/Asparaginyl beta-hydroxylase